MNIEAYLQEHKDNLLVQVCNLHRNVSACSDALKVSVGVTNPDQLAKPIAGILS